MLVTYVFFFLFFILRATAPPSSTRLRSSAASELYTGQLVDLCDVVSNNSNVISESIDVDRVLWMLAFNSVMVNLDSYSGVFAQNYYLYRDTSGRFNQIVWDLNMCFGGFPFLGSGISRLGSLTNANIQRLP